MVQLVWWVNVIIFVGFFFIAGFGIWITGAEQRRREEEEEEMHMPRQSYPVVEEYEDED